MICLEKLELLGRFLTNFLRREQMQDRKTTRIRYWNLLAVLGFVLVAALSPSAAFSGRLTDTSSSPRALSTGADTTPPKVTLPGKAHAPNDHAHLSFEASLTHFGSLPPH